MSPFAVIDIGTNSIRLGVVQPLGGLAHTLLAMHKEVVRLGEGEFATNHLTDRAIDRGILVLSSFAEVARGFGCTETICLATSALREAENQQEFVKRARDEAGVEVHVISGAEEARLIYLGVLSGADIGAQRALVIDIGGGSTELCVGDQHGSDLLESTKLGAIRLAGIFTEGEVGPIHPQLYRKIQDYVRGVAVHSVQRARQAGFDVVFGSSGTILNLCEIALRSRTDTSTAGRVAPVKLEELEIQAARLCAMGLEQRRRIPGINPERADIIVAGAAILTTLMKELGAGAIQPVDRALREGIIVDRLARMTNGLETALADSVRNRSVIALARKCQFEEAHALTVAAHSASLFDQLRKLGLHGYGERERELLRYSALLHDVGGFISYNDHHRHGYYLVRFSPLLGFDTTEVRIMAAIVLHHRKGLPKRREEAVADLSRRERQMIAVLSTIVRLAEAMDRGHLHRVQEVRCRVDRRRSELLLELVSIEDCQLELWGLQNHADVVQEVFGLRLRCERAESPAKSAA